MANQYTTLTLVEAELQADSFTMSTTPNSAQVTTWIEEVSAEIEVLSGELFTTSTVSSEYYDYDGLGIIRTTVLPLVSVDEVRYNSANINETTATWYTLESGQGKNYITYLNEGEIEFINGNAATNILTPKAGKQKFCISYTYGRATTPLEVQRLATLMVVKRVIASLVNSQANTEGGEVQVGPIRVKDPSSFSITYIRRLDREIDDLKDRIGLGFKSFRGRRVYGI